MVYILAWLWEWMPNYLEILAILEKSADRVDMQTAALLFHPIVYIPQESFNISWLFMNHIAPAPSKAHVIKDVAGKNTQSSKLAGI